MNRTGFGAFVAAAPLLAILLLLLLEGDNRIDLVKNWPKKEAQETSEPQQEEPSRDYAEIKQTDITGTDPATLKRAEGTKTYTSEKLGIRFHYNPRPVAGIFEVTVTEIGNKIYLHGTREKAEDGKKIEVFDKPASVPLAEAIRQQFIAGKPESQCWVQINDENTTDNILQAEIRYPRPADHKAPWFENYRQCSETYAAVNAARYFVYDTTRPSKYLFLDLGQDSIASDGTEPTAQGGRDWSSSIEILP
jgi:hypothetical protein